MSSFKRLKKAASEINMKLVFLVAVLVALLCCLNTVSVLSEKDNHNSKNTAPFSVSEAVKLSSLPTPLLYDKVVGEVTQDDIASDKEESSNSDDESEDHTESPESEEEQVQEEVIEEEIVEEETTQEYVVSGDETLWEIAEYFYGDGKYCPIIAIENDIDILNPVIYDGMELTIPIEADESLTYDAYISSLATESTGTEMEYFGDFKITGYDIYCAHCCNGSTDGITSSGVQATPGRTVAVSSSYGIAAGTTIYIEDYGYYIVEDSGCTRGYVDIACTSHSECYALTSVGNKSVYIVK